MWSLPQYFIWKVSALCLVPFGFSFFFALFLKGHLQNTVANAVAKQNKTFLNLENRFKYTVGLKITAYRTK